MCGIIGCLGFRGIEEVRDKLKLLDYRGYDSYGMLYFNKRYKVIKRKGEITNKIRNKRGSLFIAHTRWATSGSVSIKNAHPHESKYFYVVHNGIFKNYLDIYDKYLKGKKLYSNTDTCYFAYLLDYFYKGDTIKAIIEVMKIVEGDYAVLIVSKSENNRIYYMKKGMPLYYSNGVISSDLIVLDRGKYYLINDSYGFIDSDIYSSSELTICFKENEESINDKKPYMLYEIKEQPETIRRIYEVESKIRKNFKDDASIIYIVGCGSSYHAALMGEFFFREKGVRAIAVIASESSNLVVDSNTKFIYITQSGETKDILDMRKRYMKYASIAVTNNKNSTISNITEYLDIKSGTERAVGATKSFTNSVVTLFLLSGGSLGDVLDLINCSDKVINDENVYKLAKKLKKVENLYIVGKGLNYYAAMEGALKLREILYINAFAFPSGELKHGSLALINKSSNVIALVNNDLTRVLIDEIKSRGGKVYELSLDGYINVPDIKLSSLLYCFVFQMLAYYVGTMNKYNIDKPKNLAKSVTVE